MQVYKDIKWGEIFQGKRRGCYVRIKSEDLNILKNSRNNMWIYPVKPLRKRNTHLSFSSFFLLQKNIKIGKKILIEK